MRSKIIFLLILLACCVATIFMGPVLYNRYKTFMAQNDQRGLQVDNLQKSSLALNEHILDTRERVKEIGKDIKSDLKDMREEQRASLQGMQADMQKKLDAAVTTLQRDIKEQQLTTDVLQQHLKTLETGLQKLESNTRGDKGANDELRRKTKFSMLVIAEQAATAENWGMPKPFSYYKTEEWWQQVVNFENAAVALGERSKFFDGRENVDTFKLRGGGPVYLNGAYIRSLEILQFNNERPNAITVQAPGYADLEDDMLQIDADPDVDTVSLDGCLQWKAAKGSKNYSLWKAADKDGVQKFLKITPGVEVAVQKTCDNRYLLKEKQALLAKLWAEDSKIDTGFLDHYNSRRQMRNANGGLDGEALPDISGEKSPRVVDGPCAFGENDLPDDFVVLASGTHNGRPVGFAIDDSGAQARQADLVVNYPGKPVALLLGSYEPIIWNIRQTKGTKIVAVAAGGHYRTVIASLDEGVPTKIFSHYDQKNKGRDYPCETFSFSADDTKIINPVSRRMFGQPVSMFFNADGGSAIVGLSGAPTSALLKPTGVTPESFQDASQPLPGKLGIKDALKKGLLEPVAVEDIEAWRKAAKLARLKRNEDIPPTPGQQEPVVPEPRMEEAYIIKEGFVFPPALTGANSVQFILPEGQKMPQGKPGHSYVFDMNDPGCTPALIVRDCDRMMRRPPPYMMNR